jgi:hypothetical protein
MTQAGHLIAATAEAALHGATAATRVVLTAHAVAMGRAEAGAKRLDDYLGGLRGTGVLAGFNREFKKRRMAAAATGEGYMTYSKALARLRAALVLIAARNLRPGGSRKFFDRYSGRPAGVSGIVSNVIAPPLLVPEKPTQRDSYLQVVVARVSLRNRTSVAQHFAPQLRKFIWAVEMLDAGVDGSR